MKAIILKQFGGPESLIYDEVDKPTIDDNEVLISMKAAGVNPVDYKIGKGARKDVFPVDLPWIPGKDFAGTIEKIGASVKDFKVNDRVFGNASGCYAEYIKTSPTSIAIIPEKVTFQEAASLPIAGQTAWECLFDYGQLEREQTVLIHGGAGGVGIFAVQLAHWKGARVLATASTNHIEFLKKLGADEAIDYTKTPFESKAKNVDLVIDLISGETQKQSLQCLKKGGRLVSTLELVVKEEADKLGIQAMNMRMQTDNKTLARLADLIANRKIKTFITSTYPLKDAKMAWEEILTGHMKGKIVLT